jgi:hypothetical protein
MLSSSCMVFCCALVRKLRNRPKADGVGETG